MKYLSYCALCVDATSQPQHKGQSANVDVPICTPTLALEQQDWCCKQRQSRCTCTEPPLRLR